MAYGEKYRLFFDDIDGRRYKLDILQKDYDGVVKPLIGGADPVQIEWVADEDIYYPIIGSRCKIDLFVTDSNVYDEFFKGDERKYKVNIGAYQPTGRKWDDEVGVWNELDFKWNHVLGGISYNRKVWTGFLVLDSYQEFVLSKPYPLKLEAIDGLGTLSGFDAPFNTGSTEKSAFYYIKEILKLTGLNLPIRIANGIRRVGYESNTDDTIFHDIILPDYAMFDEKLNHLNAKKALEDILRITNSRIFQEDGLWYIVSNSGLIDKDIDEEALAPSGADTASQALAQDFFNLVKEPSVAILGTTSREVGSDFEFTAYNKAGIFGTWSSLTWTLPDGSTVSDVPTVRFTATQAMDGQTISVSVTNSAGSDSDTKTLTIVAGQSSQQNLEVNIFIDSTELENCSTDSAIFRYAYQSGQVGQTLDIDNIRVTANNVYRIPTEQSISATGDLTVQSYTGVDEFDGGGFKHIDIDLGSITLPAGGARYDVKLTGKALLQIIRRRITIQTQNTDGSVIYLNNAEVKKNATDSNTITYVDITGEPNTTASTTIEVLTVGDFLFESSDNVVSRFINNIQGLRAVPNLISQNRIQFRIYADIGFEDETSVMRLTGTGVGDVPATFIKLDPPGLETVDGSIIISGNGGFLDGITLQTDGKFIVKGNVDWISFSPNHGVESTEKAFLTIKENKTGAQREVTFTFHSDDGGDEAQLNSVRVVQAASTFDGLITSDNPFTGGG